MFKSRRRIWAIAVCMLAGGALGLTAAHAFPRRFTSSVEFWFYGGRRSFGPANALVLRAVREAYAGVPGQHRFLYPSYDLQKIPVSIQAKEKESGRKTVADLMTAAIAAGERVRTEMPDCSSLWLEAAAVPALSDASAGGFTWTGYLRLHTPVPLRLDRVLLEEQIRDIKARIGSERFQERLIARLPFYRLELNSDTGAMKRFMAVVRKNLRFERGPQEDVLRIVYTSDDAAETQALLAGIVKMLESQNRMTRDAEFGKRSFRQAWPFEIANPPSPPEGGSGQMSWWIVGLGILAGALLGTTVSARA